MWEMNFIMNDEDPNEVHDWYPSSKIKSDAPVDWYANSIICLIGKCYVKDGTAAILRTYFQLRINGNYSLAT